MPHDRHDGPILRADHVMHSDRVSQHDVGLLDATVRSRPRGQTLARSAQGGEVGGRIFFLGLIRRHPKAVIDDTGSSPGVIIGSEECSAVIPGTSW